MDNTISDEELKRIVDMLFNHFKKPWILESEFNNYLKSKGFTDEEVNNIWFQAFRKGLVIVTGT